jgi:hypothetical protein
MPGGILANQESQQSTFEEPQEANFSLMLFEDREKIALFPKAFIDAAWDDFKKEEGENGSDDDLFPFELRAPAEFSHGSCIYGL